VTLQAMPERPIVEVADGSRFVNFDMVVRNVGSFSLRLSQIELSVFDSARHLVLRKSINTDAFAPSIAVIGKQTLAPGEALDVFNPFPEFDSNIPLAKLEYRFCLQRESNEREREANRHRLPGDCDFQETLVVETRVYETRTKLILPLQGTIFVWEGHDLYSHHQRVPLSDSAVKAIGITANSNNFAGDFIYLDEQGHPYHDDPRVLENWYSYAKSIYAPGAGVVLAAMNSVPENRYEDAKASKISYPKLPVGVDPKDLGNFVLIDHQNGEYSLLLHMRPGSVRVRTGDHVRRGEFLGRIGFSGDSIFPHLHYTLMDGPEVFKAWGLPAYFSQFQPVTGARSTKSKRGPVNSGDFLRSTAEYSESK
jgi:hypothetical protein